MDKTHNLKLQDENWTVNGECRILLSGNSFVADTSGALYWPVEDTLIIADLHFEKGSSLARKGVHLPPYDTRATLVRLGEVIAKYEPARVVALGDSLHDSEAAERIQAVDLERLNALQDNRNWIWITGNHDPEIPDMIGGEVTDVLPIGRIKFRHEPVKGPVVHEIAGHLHPVAKISQRSRVLRRRCFVSNGARLVLPAFGAFTGGLNVLDDAFAPLFSGGSMFIWMIGSSDIFPIAPRQLLSD